MENFENLCRFCLKSLYDSSRVNIFDEDNIKRNTVDKVLSCLSLIVSEDDTLPNYICFPCAEKLDSFQDFRDTCHKSESFLIKLASMKDVSLREASKTQSPHSRRSQKRPNTEDLNLRQQPQQVFVKVECPDQTFDELLSNTEIPSSSLNTVQEGTYGSAVAFEPPPGIEIRRVTQGRDSGSVVKTEAYSEEAICDTGSAFQYTGTEDSAANESDMYGDDDRDEGGFSGQYSGDISAQSSNVKGEDDDEDIILLSDDSDNEGANVITSQVPSEPKTKRAKKASFGESSAGNRGSMPGTSQESVASCSNVGRVTSIYFPSSTPRQSSYTCSWCTKSFIVPCQLKRHVLIHTGETPFSCSVCGKRFKRKDHLKSHSAVHLNSERPFYCSKCSSTFTTEKSMRQHTTWHAMMGD